MPPKSHYFSAPVLEPQQQPTAEAEEQPEEGQVQEAVIAAVAAAAIDAVGGDGVPVARSHTATPHHEEQLGPGALEQLGPEHHHDDVVDESMAEWNALRVIIIRDEGPDSEALKRWNRINRKVMTGRNRITPDEARTLFDAEEEPPLRPAPQAPQAPAAMQTTPWHGVTNSTVGSNYQLGVRLIGTENEPAPSDILLTAVEKGQGYEPFRRATADFLRTHEDYGELYKLMLLSPSKQLACTIGTDVEKRIARRLVRKLSTGLMDLHLALDSKPAHGAVGSREEGTYEWYRDFRGAKILHGLHAKELASASASMQIAAAIRKEEEEKAAKKPRVEQTSQAPRPRYPVPYTPNAYPPRDRSNRGGSGGRGGGAGGAAAGAGGRGGAIHAR
jgi:hypothetical protein